jgi:hypothetical protein
MTKIITLTKGKFTLVDDDNYEELSKYKWQYHSLGYAIRSTPSVLGKQGHMFMHREIMHTPIGMQTDHINGNKLDNRKINLRVCSVSENHMNAKKSSNKTSGYKGVCWDKYNNKWKAYIGKKHLGVFTMPEIGARVYDEEAKRLFGKFAKLNFPD